MQIHTKLEKSPFHQWPYLSYSSWKHNYNFRANHFFGHHYEMNQLVLGLVVSYSFADFVQSWSARNLLVTFGHIGTNLGGSWTMIRKLL